MATPKKTHVAAIEGYDGESIKLPLRPRPMTNRVAIDILQRAEEEANQEIEIIDTFKGVFPWDGALALQKALKLVFGYSFAENDGCCEKPKMVPVAISETETILVPWGRFTLPGLPSASISTGTDENKHFQIMATLRRRDQPALTTLLAKIRELVSTESLYRGKIVQFVEGKRRPGEKVALPEITFLSPTITPPIFTKFIEDAIDALILTPIRHRLAVKRSGTPIKRGVLLAGRYGTGKTLLAAKIANVAKAEGWTTVYVAHPDELLPALEFAKMFQPVVVFIEDIDRVIGPDRNDDVNAMINTVDGVGTKDAEVILVMTTNHPEQINPAMLRNGRIDVRLLITPPDGPAVERLIRHYGGASLDKNASLSVPAHRLAGQIPATIRESVERAKLFALTRTFGSSDRITTADLIGSGEMLLAENDLFIPKDTGVTRLELLGRGIGHEIAGMLRNYSAFVEKNPKEAADMLLKPNKILSSDLIPVTDHEPSIIEQTTR